MPVSGEVWVIDTSSITAVRRSLERVNQRAVFGKLTRLVQAGHLVFPAEVLDELERGANPTQRTGEDLPLEWARGVAGEARSNPSLDTVREVLSRVPTVLDPDKTTGVEEADPYILALALELRGAGRDVAVITEEKNDKPNKLSLSSAAGILKIPALTMLPFLRSQGLLP